MQDNTTQEGRLYGYDMFLKALLCLTQQPPRPHWLQWKRGEVLPHTGGQVYTATSKADFFPPQVLQLTHYASGGDILIERRREGEGWEHIAYPEELRPLVQELHAAITTQLEST